MKFTESPLLSLRLPAWRSRFVLVLLWGGFLGLILRSAWLQGVQDEFLQKKGESRYERVIEVSANRGRIVDRHGDVLAMSTPVESIWAVPQAVSLDQEKARQLAKLVEMTPKALREKLGGNRDFVYLKRQVAPSLAAEVMALEITGVNEQREYRRYYPLGEVAAHLTGFAGIDEKGLEGIELAQESRLSGEPGRRKVIRNRRGQIVDDVQAAKAPRHGDDVRLSIDAKLQYLAHSELRRAVSQHKAKAGSVVVLDATSGEVLALANLPVYNPNARGKLSGAQLRNRALTDLFEPGSVLKPFVAAQALAGGKVRAHTRLNTENGRFRIGAATITDTHPEKVMTVAEVVQKSSNIGVAKLALDFQPRDFAAMLTALGFGEAPKVGFPGVAAGVVRPWKRWRPIEQATMAYGHGLSVSLLQIARAYTVFATDGELLAPVLLEKNAREQKRRVFPAGVVAEVRAMLEKAASAEGTGRLAQVPGYRVAGKTGTTHKLENGAYVKKYISSFAGLMPVSEPRLVIAVMIDEPNAGKHYGGEVAAPVFAAIGTGAMRLLGVVPDAPYQVATATAAEGAQ